MNIFVHMLPKFCLCLCEHIYVFVLNKNGSCLLFWNFLIFIFLLVNIEMWGFFLLLIYPISFSYQQMTGSLLYKHTHKIYGLIVNTHFLLC